MNKKNGDWFCDWMVERIAELRDGHTHYINMGEEWTARKVEGHLSEAERIMRVYDAIKATAGTFDDDGEATG